MTPVRLEPRRVPRPWGSHRLRPWFADSEHDKIGEVWFETAEVPLLIKFLFTTENLSVQVHPDDEYAREQSHPRGKTEMWHILRAEPGAKIALGFKRPVTKDELRDSAKSGDIVNLLQWQPARVGDTFFAPAGTVHAIGAGLTLCEVQQHSDVTYRLYDFGRDRELHLDHGERVSNLGRCEGARAPESLAPDHHRLVRCEYFTTDLLDLNGSHEHDDSRAHIWICLEGEGRIGAERFAAGDTFYVPGRSGPVTLRSDRAKFLKTGP